jgi:hypothetical protein
MINTIVFLPHLCFALLICSSLRGLLLVLCARNVCDLGLQARVYLDIGLNSATKDNILGVGPRMEFTSLRSAYKIQFKGNIVLFYTDLIWKAQAENNCKIFTWILVQDKIHLKLPLRV